MARYAQGKFALAVSDISGQSFPWNEMVTQWNGLFVHYSEFESKQPQLDPKPSQADPTALPKTRPQQSPADALRFLEFNPLVTYAAASGIINVKSLDHQRSYGDTVRFRGPPTTSPGTGTPDTIGDDGPVAGNPVVAFANIANIDGISGATICKAAGFTIYPGKYTSTTTTLNGALDDSTTTIVLTSGTNFTGVSTGVVEPTSTNTSGTPTWGILVDTEIISYTGVSTHTLTGVTRGAFGSTAAAHDTGATVRLLHTPANWYHFNSTGTATSGSVKGGAWNISSGPVTLKTIGPQ
tara:strand:+ start:1420 stop:2304 length:885 start_codon:yes stop_codon:yes gene_type:complete